MKTIKEIFRSWAVFDAQGRHVNGTDKQSNHSYGDAYDQILSVTERVDIGSNRIPLGTYSRSIRGDVRLMMEVGVADGSSLLAWSYVFPNARCVGLDIHIAEKVAGGRYNNTEFHLGDQCVREDCERAAGGRMFDFIVEDATHQLANTLLTLFYLWPFVRPGGLLAGDDDGLPWEIDYLVLYPLEQDDSVPLTQ